MNRKALAAIAIVAAAMAASSVVLWPLAVPAIPLLFWVAVSGGRLARWSAAAVAAVTVLEVVLAAVWMVTDGSTGSFRTSAWFVVSVAIVVCPAALAAFVIGSEGVGATGSNVPVAPAA